MEDRMWLDWEGKRQTREVENEVGMGDEFDVFMLHLILSSHSTYYRTR